MPQHASSNVQHALHARLLVGGLAVRKTLIVAALAAVAATSASAKAPRHLHDAAASLTENNVFTSGLAIKGGKVVGQDPDANVRFELQRDNPFY
jgi:hypothetical protein